MSKESKRLPLRLKKDVLTEAVFEIRFSAKEGTTDLLPGRLEDLFEAECEILHLPLAEVPAAVRAQFAREQPYMRLRWDNFFALIGDGVLGLAVASPYPGWETFHANIKRLVKKLNGLERIQEVTRYSLKYVDFFDAKSYPDYRSLFDVSINVADRGWKEEPLSLQIAFKEGKIISLFELMSPVQMVQNAGESRLGSLLSVDSFFDGPPLRWEDFVREYEEQSETLHRICKEIFFCSLTTSAIEMLEPVYE